MGVSGTERLDIELDFLDEKRFLAEALPSGLIRIALRVPRADYLIALDEGKPTFLTLAQQAVNLALKGLPLRGERVAFGQVGKLPNQGSADQCRLMNRAD
jgi:hypothetical protein